MTTEPTGTPDEPTTAQKLAQHPRWEWRAGMIVRRYTGNTFMVADVDPRAGDVTLYDSGHRERDWTSMKLADMSDMLALYTPDLADDATAGIVLGIVRAWAGGRDDGDVMTEWSQNDDDWRVDARRFDPDYIQHAGFGPTLGDAAGACLLACWARDAQGAGR